jgi:hypothetical protein
MGNRAERQERGTKQWIKREQENVHWIETVLTWVRNGHS